MAAPLSSKSKFKKTEESDDFETFKLTFDNVYHSFVNTGCNDVFDGMMRSEYRTKCSTLPPEQQKAKFQRLKQQPKQIETDNMNYPIDDPFVVMGYDTKTPIQEKAIQHSGWMPFYGNYAYCCSCGAGKTLAGIYMIYK